ncbi:MAG: endolytic transglycosylase MltG [Bacteroidota bacterium]
MSNLKKVLWATALLGLALCGIITYRIYKAVFVANTAFEQPEVVIFVSSGTSFKELKVLMTPYVKDLQTFEAVAIRKGYFANVKGGKYLLKKGMNNNSLINTLRSGNTAVRVSFNNQETLEALAGRIAAQLEPDSLALLQAFNDHALLADNGFDVHNTLTPYLPNTYEFFWNTSPEGFTKRMLEEYRRFWNEERVQKAKKLGLSPAEVSSLAAIVQKETVKIDERPRVAGVYLNRLSRGIHLQADPTVIYALKKAYGKNDTIIKRVLYRDLEIDSPYNTYKYEGLPPGPIAMPDLSAIKAVLNPESHEYLFFVADVSRPGYHLFAKTLAQHNENKSQYIRWLDRQSIKR